MDKRKAAVIHRELNLIAKELQAEAKPAFQDLDWSGKDKAVRSTRKEVGLPEEPRFDENVSVRTYTENRNQKGYDVEISISWASLGGKDLATTKKFADELNKALDKTKKLSDALKKNFPGIKLKGV